MPFSTIGREVVRGTVCKDRWLAEITLMCADRLPVAAGAPLFLAIDWRDERDAPEIPDQPEDAKPVVLTLRKRSPAAGGDLRFDGSDGPTTKGFTTEVRGLFTLFGRAGSTGTLPDVDLEVKVEDEVRGTIPLFVGSPTVSVAIRAENGTDLPAAFLVPDHPLRLRAVADPPDTAGTFRWISGSPAALEIRGSATEATVEVVGRGGAGERQLMVLYTPPGGAAAMAAHRIQLAGELTYRGRLLDTIGLPIPGVEVSAELYNGTQLRVPTITDAAGRFEMSCPLRPELRVVFRRGAERLALRQEPTEAQLLAPVELGDVVMRLPVELTGPVVDGTPAAPVDLARLQDRLVHVGRLSAADAAAEPTDPTSAAAVDVATRPLLLAALCAHLRAGTGRRLLEAHPADPTLDVVNADPLFPLAPIAVASAVGEEPGAPPPPAATLARADVRLVQDRLRQLGFLLPAAYRAERVDPATAPAQVPAAGLAQTLDAIRRFDSAVALGSLRSIAPGREGERLLGDPWLFGLAPLALSGSVGEDGENRTGDVRALQDRLLTLGYLASPDHAAELAPPADPATPAEPLDPATLPATMAALGAARTARFQPRAAGEPDRLDLRDPALDRLNHPPRVDLRSGVGIREAQVAENHAADVRAVQDRLLLLGFLPAADHATERVNPARPAPVDVADIPQTIASLTTFRQAVVLGGVVDLTATSQPVRILPGQRPPALALTGTVGAGGQNARADVRAVQDRLLALRLLRESDHRREVVDPARTGPVDAAALASTFAAIVALQVQVLRLPATVAGEAWTADGVVRPGEATHRILSDPLFFGRERIELRGSVGEAGWNRRPEVRAVQDRLRELRLLTDAHHEAERVEPAGAAPADAAALPETRRAIARLRERFLGETLPVVARIEAAHPLLLALRNPLLATAHVSPLPASLWSAIDLAESVGAGGTNVPREVRAVQDRLRDLGFLAPDDHAAEAVDPSLAGPVGVGAIPATLGAIALWQQRMLPAGPAGGLVEPLDATLRLLNRPVLPAPVQLALTDSVGAQPAVRPAVNRHPSLRRVQDRLHSLGLLSTGDYLAERVPAAGGGTSAAATIPQTLAAVERFQRTASGGADRIVSVGGMAERVLNDPTHGTPTLTNPNTDYANAGPALPVIPHALWQIIHAIEAHEAGPSTGEVPAILRNGSGTPASYGRAQLIGSTGLGTLQGDAAFAGFYLTPAALASLAAVSADTNTRYDDIFALVPAPGVTEVALVAAIAAYVGVNLAAFHFDTGLGARDVERMFRTAQFRRHCRSFIDAQPVPPGTAPGDEPAARRAAAAAAVGNFLADADRVANVNALGFRPGDVTAFLAVARDNEHRAGFVSRALLHAPGGQPFRNALTDESGIKLGRMLIRSNFNRVNAAAGAGALTDQQRAQVVARVHNQGAGGLAGWVANPATAVNAYVNAVMAHWVP